MILFYIASIVPPLLILVAAFAGAVWAWAALVYMVAAVAVLDELLPEAPANPAEATGPWANLLSVLLALLHMIVLTSVVAAVNWQPLGAMVPLVLAAALFFGQVSNSNAHELIHRQSRWLRRLGTWVYTSMLFGHHASAHLLVHHVSVATRDDPNSARWGEGYYRFLIRAWIGSFRLGLAAERARLDRAGRSRLHNPYLGYLAGALLGLALAALIGGGPGVAVFVLLAAMAQCQLMLSDYVQHYGLRREAGPNGKPEPLSARHSWNSPHRFSSALMLNATRHSDHHGSPARPYPDLRLPEAPMLPRALPVMACIALVPPVWRRIMDPRATQWQSR